MGRWKYNGVAFAEKKAIYVFDQDDNKYFEGNSDPEYEIKNLTVDYDSTEPMRGKWTIKFTYKGEEVYRKLFRKCLTNRKKRLILKGKEVKVDGGALLPIYYGIGWNHKKPVYLIDRKGDKYFEENENPDYEITNLTVDYNDDNPMRGKWTVKFIDEEGDDFVWKVEISDQGKEKILEGVKTEVKFHHWVKKGLGLLRLENEK
ncbi:MAG: hypothetical protein O4861_17745 [Trichodesmium sp. St16_bin4-tuft]|nr:hypothetical protein [Trichodesmium sp. St4_bin8_1]MDE5070645.1 hypothetical protein [Trichodesmium sp. St5_bin8]MDE5100073.1 hypothetical protein [Trichodesmium sp. St16_bin4-tuft]MDE5103335.1 hypothetical protein [Trichodesmium sp. St19_bin2]